MKIYETPIPLQSDAYTIGSNILESKDALTRSDYYLTFRKFPHSKEPSLYNSGDNRILFMGIGQVIDKLFSHQTTHKDVDECIKFNKSRKYTTAGLSDFDFPEKMWRLVVDKYNGYLPLSIMAVPEGSVVYPNEPVIRVSNTDDGFGQLAAYFEAAIMNYVWSQTARLTAARHWLERNIEMIQKIESCSYEEALPKAQIMMHDFGSRAAICLEESESLGLIHLLCFGGTDTFSGAYQAWKNGAPSYIGGSVPALAHRIVQGFIREGDAYENMYNTAPDNSILSMVADCYNYKNAVLRYLIPLALRSKQENNGKIIVVRPDSGDALEQVLWTLRETDKVGLMETKDNGLKYSTTLKVIMGDSQNFSSMRKINDAVIAAGFAPHGCYIFGVGGYLRNSITRDDMSTKYALCACNDRPVIKQSEVVGKQTLPIVAVVRNKFPETIRGVHEENPDRYNCFSVHDIHINYYTHSKDQMRPYILNEDFNAIQSRVLKDFPNVPLNGGLLSDYVKKYRQEILEKCI